MAQITREEYNKVAAVNFSLLKLYMRSPAHFYQAWSKGQDADEVEAETKALRMGKAIHTYVLEPEKFKEKYVFVDFDQRPVKTNKSGGVADYRTKENKDWKESMIAFYQVHGKTVLNSRDEFDEITSMGHSINKNKASNMLLRDCLNEEFIEWTDAETGVKCKAIVDFANVKKRMYGDLKSMEDASPYQFGTFLAKWNTAVQLAYYGDGLSAVHGAEFQTAFVIAIEKKPPFVCQPYYIDEKAIEAGRMVYRSLLAMHKKCVETGVFGGYDTQYENTAGVIVSGLPTWAHNRLENDEKLQTN